MRLSQKLIAGYALVCIAVVALGYFGLNAARQTAKAFEGGEAHFRAIVTAANEAGSYAKRAEGHMMLYLTLGDPGDRDKFFARCQSLEERIETLRDAVKKPEARAMVSRMEEGSKELCSAGKALLEHYDGAVQGEGESSPARHAGLIRRINARAEAVRLAALELADYETDFLNRQTAVSAATEASGAAKQAEGHMMLFIALGDEGERQKYLQSMNRLQESIAVLERRVRTVQGLNVLEDIKTGAHRLEETGGALLSAYTEDAAAGRKFQLPRHAALIRDLNDYAAAVRGKGILLAELKVTAEAETKRRAIQQSEAIQRSVILIMSGTLLLVVFFGYILYRSVTLPVKALERAASSIARGKLGAGVSVTAGGELGELAASFREMSSELSRTMVSRKYVDNIFRSMTDALVVTDLNFAIQTVNPALLDMLGYDEGELPGKPLSMILDDGAWFLLEVMKRGEALNAEKVFKAKDGREVPVLLAASVLYDAEDVRGVVCTAHDLTERKKMEEAVLAARKLESVGLLASGIAHDFNNFLTAILGNIEVAKLSAAPGSVSLERLEAAGQATLRARDLTQQLLTFSRGGAPVKKAVNIADVVKDSAQLAVSGSAVKFEMSVPEPPWPVMADEWQMGRVVHNIIINAIAAMPGGGTLRVAVENAIPSPEEAPSLAGSKCVRITFEDTGTGIAADNLSRVFDHYFTTRPDGVGLGLAVSRSIVVKHGGHIGVRSPAGGGAVFTVYLPASDGKAEEAASRESPEASLAGSGRILVMDDEEMVRDVAGEMLIALGYEVDFARDGREALEKYRMAMEGGMRFDMVILDLTVPGGMGGAEAVRKLRELDPEVKAVASSGYSADPVMAEFEEHGFSDVVAKPYRLDELGRALRGLKRNTGASSGAQ